jgi:hypothetical protein
MPFEGENMANLIPQQEVVGLRGEVLAGFQTGFSKQ